MAERQEALQAAAAEDGVAKAAMSELVQQKQVLIQDNEACEAAISDVTDRKQVLLAISIKSAAAAIAAARVVTAAAKLAAAAQLAVAAAQGATADTGVPAHMVQPLLTSYLALIMLYRLLFTLNRLLLVILLFRLAHLVASVPVPCWCCCLMTCSVAFAQRLSYS